MATYIIQVMVIQVLFLAVYDFFLSKETFHNYNRWYLLGAPVLSFVLPLVKIPSLGQTVSQDFMMYFPEAILGSQQLPSQNAVHVVNSINYTNVIYGIGVLFFSVVFLVKLAKIIRLIVENEQIDKKIYKLILLSQQSKAFSFFHFIFLGKNIATDQQEKIIQHELVHSQQKHSIDLLVFEFLRICMWFNPMIYIYQRRITLLHEYISDAEMVKTTEKHDYFNKLLSEAFQVENVSFVNQFYKHSLIKKRITMMKKNKSNPFKKAKYLLLLPLLASMLVYTSCDTNEEIVETPLIQEEVAFDVANRLPVIMLNEIVVDGNQDEIVEKEIVSSSGDFHTNVRNFIFQNFNRKLINDPNSQVKIGKIYAVFTIDENGVLKDLRVRAPSEALKSETMRVISSLKNIQPALKDGKPVAMSFTFPISFNKEGVNPKGLVEVNERIADANSDVPFSIIEEVPVYPGCTGTKQEMTDCLNSKIKSFVAKNFDDSMVQNLGLTSGKKKIYVVFRIDETGNITEINARAPHEELKKEAIRVASLLPKLQPGKQRGKAVGMRYTLPISFNVK